MFKRSIILSVSVLLSSYASFADEHVNKSKGEAPSCLASEAPNKISHDNIIDVNNSDQTAGVSTNQVTNNIDNLTQKPTQTTADDNFYSKVGEDFSSIAVAIAIIPALVGAGIAKTTLVASALAGAAVATVTAPVWVPLSYAAYKINSYAANKIRNRNSQSTDASDKTIKGLGSESKEAEKVGESGQHEKILLHIKI